MADRLLPPQVAEMSCYSVAEEITSVCADSLVVRAVWPNRSAAGGAESPRFSRHPLALLSVDLLALFGAGKIAGGPLCGWETSLFNALRTDAKRAESRCKHRIEQ